MGLKEVFQDIMKNYKIETMQGKFGKEHRMFQILNYTVKDEISKVINSSQLVVKGSCGQGGWTSCPWIAVYNRDITNTIQEGVYIVYLFSEDMERLYITLNQGCTNLKKELGQKKATEQMVNIREEVRVKIDPRAFEVDNNLNIGNRDYETGSIFYKLYTKDNIPDEQQLQIDLSNMIDIYNQYYDLFYEGKEKEESDVEKMSNDNINKTKETISKISNYILSKSFIYNYNDLANFYLSLKTKPFVILAGVSGTGKSKLVRLFAEAVGATSDNGQFNMISVKPDWNDNTELFGYKNISDEFIPGKLTSIILEAMKDENKNKPYFVCLDEMNLARVEYYLSDYLSLIESREYKGDEIVTDKIFWDNYHSEDSSYKNLYLPGNLYLIGTVNMDDTTYAFSRKVLDRANTIEFSQVNLENLNFNLSNAPSEIIDNNFLKAKFLNISQAIAEDEAYVRSINDKVIKINEILKKGNRHFGYRVRDEIVFYMLENKLSNVIENEDYAFDYMIMQKILPTISGSDARIKSILIGLYNICNESKQIADTASYIEDAEKFVDSAKYKKSAVKIIEMLRGYDDGFTSYWI